MVPCATAWRVVCGVHDLQFMLVDYYKAALLTRRTDLAGPEQRLAVLSTAKVSPVQSSRPSRPSLVSAAPCATDVNEVMAWLQRCCGCVMCLCPKPINLG